MPRPLAFAAVPLSALALLAAGCGGDDGNATTEWAGDLCTAITTWTGAIGDAVNSVQGTDLTQQAVEEAADEARVATETFVEDLDELGPPDTEAGDEAKAAIDQLAEDIRQDLDELESALDDATGIAGAVSSVTSTISTMGVQLGSTLQQLEQLDARGELEAAFQDAPACAQLAS